jgi:gluconolactonase
MAIRNNGLLSLILAMSAAATPAAANEHLAAICGECVVEKVATCGGFLEGLAVSPEGELWVMDLTGDRMLELRDGECIERGRAGGSPNGAKFRPDGTLLIVGRQGLVAFEPESGAMSTLLTAVAGEPLRSPNDLAIDAMGGVYLTEVRESSFFRRTGRVLYLPPGGGEPQVVADGIAFPNGIAVSPGGRNLLVSEFATKQIISVPAVGAPPGLGLAYVHVITSGGIGADGLFIDHHGRLHTAQFGAGAVQVFAPDGVEIATIPLPEGAGALVTNFAFADGYLYISEAARGEVWRVRLVD